MLNEFSASVGWSKNMMLMNDMAIFRLNSGTQFVQTIFTTTQIKNVIMNSIIGSIDIKNSLKNVFEGNGPVISMSVKKQSNDKNVSDEEHTLSTG